MNLLGKHAYCESIGRVILWFYKPAYVWCVLGTSTQAQKKLCQRALRLLNNLCSDTHMNLDNKSLLQHVANYLRYTVIEKKTMQVCTKKTLKLLWNLYIFNSVSSTHYEKWQKTLCLICLLLLITHKWNLTSHLTWCIAGRSVLLFFGHTRR